MTPATHLQGTTVSSRLPAGPGTSRGWSNLGWAVYLASSWTWCIGMVLPVLLLRDYGWAGYLVFLVPNVLGAAAMGWLIPSRAASEQFVTTHAGMIRVFSVVTIAFHGLTLGWLGRELLGRGVWGLFGAILAWTMVTRLLGRSWHRWGAAAAYVLSLFMAAVLIGHRMRLGLEFPRFEWLPNPLAVAALAPVCLLGFALCPYLDPTFHRARQSLTSGESKIAFSLGFGVFFLGMILLTALYADLLRSGVGLGVVAIPILVHLVGQSAFTIAAHAREMPGTGGWKAGLVPAGAAAGGLWLGMFASGHYHGIAVPEAFYRLFLGFYGLFAPAYLLVFSPDPVGRGRGWIILAAVCALAGPCYWLGFLEQREGWLLPGVGLIVMGAFIAARGRRARQARYLP
jgi:hypothetical protein